MVRKKYVRVTADFDPRGMILPLAVTWEDGTRYEVDRVLDVRRRPSKPGDTGSATPAGSWGGRPICSSNGTGGLWRRRAARRLGADHKIAGSPLLYLANQLI